MLKTDVFTEEERNRGSTDGENSRRNSCRESEDDVTVLADAGTVISHKVCFIRAGAHTHTHTGPAFPRRRSVN